MSLGANAYTFMCVFYDFLPSLQTILISRIGLFSGYSNEKQYNKPYLDSIMI